MVSNRRNLYTQLIFNVKAFRRSFEIKVNELDFNSGIYVLEIYLEAEKELNIGALGDFKFPSGYYYYCGTAQKNLISRLKRHLSTDKKLYWHIDYVLAAGNITRIFTWPQKRSFECSLAQNFVNKDADIIVPGFGSSDCNCSSHLFYFSHVINKQQGFLEKAQIIEINSLS